MTETFVEKINQEVKRVGFEALSIKGGEYEGEKIVLAHSKNKKEYATWVYNTETDCLFGGRYFSYYMDTDLETAKKFALVDFDRRKK